MSTSSEAMNQRRFDAVATVTKSMYLILGVEEPETLAISEPCSDVFGNETDEMSSRYGSNEVDLGRRAEKSLIDDVLAGFGEPPKRADFPDSQLGSGESARIVDFELVVDDLDIDVSAFVTDSGRFGWSARTGCR